MSLSHLPEMREIAERVETAGKELRDDNRRTRRWIKIQIACVFVQVAAAVLWVVAH